jgi:hypothetical protein
MPGSPVAKTIQDFALHVQEVSARPSAPTLNSDRARNITRRIFQAQDKREQHYLRIIARVLDELLNHRRYATCSGGAGVVPHIDR